MYWLGYEQLARALDQREDEGQASYMAKSFGAGAGAGMVAAFLTTPFDVIKTRRQVALPGGEAGAAAAAALPRYIYDGKGGRGRLADVAMRGTFLSINLTYQRAAHTCVRIIHHTPRQPMPSMQTALRCVVATEGYQALFSGALPRTLRIGAYVVLAPIIVRRWRYRPILLLLNPGCVLTRACRPGVRHHDQLVRGGQVPVFAHGEGEGEEAAKQQQRWRPALGVCGGGCCSNADDAAEQIQTAVIFYCDIDTEDARVVEIC